VRCGWFSEARYDEAVAFYRDAIGLQVLETFRDSYGLDGTILACQAARFTWRSFAWRSRCPRRADWTSWCSSCRPAAAQEQVRERLAAAGVHPVAQIAYWEVNGGITYQDPDGREVVFASWVYVPPRS
jgi:hypothetical protein